MDLPSCDDRRIWDVWMSHYHFPTLAVANDVGLFAFLAKKAATPEQTAKALKLGPRATEALLGVLNSLGFVERRGGKFHVTEVMRHFLVPGAPYYWGGMLSFIQDMAITRKTLKEALLKDRPMAYQGKDMWETHEMDARQAEVFTAAMHTRSMHVAVATAMRGDFAGVRRLLDVGGGSGCYPIALALRHPDLRATIMDLKVVCPIAEKYIAEAGLSDRIDTLALDMFRDRWPKGYDAVFFSNIYHDWGRKRCLRLTKSSFGALPRGGRIFIHEMLINDTLDGPLVPATNSMHMMFFTEGKQYSAAEFESMLGKAGFRDMTITPTYGYYSLVSAIK